MDKCLTIIDFFKYKIHLTQAELFRPYGIEHLSILILFVACFVLLFAFTRKYSDEQKYKFLKFWGVFLFLMQILFSAWSLYIGHFWESEGLPLHLCSMQFLILPLALYKKNQILLDFFCLTGPVGAILFFIMPDTLSNNYPIFHYHSVQSWIFHAIIIFAGLYLLLACKYRPNIKNFPKVLAASVIFFAVAALGNLTGGNYMFLTKAPAGTPIAFFESLVGWPYYNICTIALAIVVFYLQYKIFALIPKGHAKTVVEQSLPIPK